jgi:hypothetical protein
MNYNALRGLRKLLNDSYITTAEWKKVLAHFDTQFFQSKSSEVVRNVELAAYLYSTG